MIDVQRSMADSQPQIASETWRSPDGQLVLRYSPALLEEIRAHIMMAMHGPGRGGVETGGLLLGGPNAAGDIVLEGWRPIRCDHSRGSSFLLSNRDVAALACQVEGLSGGGTGGVAGWFAAHTRGELGLRAEELQLHGRVFPAPASLFVAIAPDKYGDADLRFYLISGGEKPSSSPVPGQLRLAPAPSLARPASANPAPAGPRVVRAARPNRLRWLWPAIAALSAIAFMVSSWSIWNSPRAQAVKPAPAPAPQPTGAPQPAFTLHIERVDNRLEISWDTPPSLPEPFTATLTVLDQGRAFVRRLSPEEIDLGRIAYTRPTSEIRVSLLLEPEKASPRLARAHYQGPPPLESQ